VDKRDGAGPLTLHQETVTFIFLKPRNFWNLLLLTPLEGADSQTLKALCIHKRNFLFILSLFILSSIIFLIDTFPRVPFYRMLILEGFNIEDILLHERNFGA